MNNIEPGPTVLNIASVCPRCQTVFTHEVNVYALAVKELTEAQRLTAADLRTAIERAEKAEAALKLSSDCGRGHISASELAGTLEALKIARRAMECHCWNKSSDHGCLEFVAVRAVNDDIFRLETLQKEAARKERCTICGSYVTDWVDPDGASGRICRPCETLRKESAS